MSITILAYAPHIDKVPIMCQAETEYKSHGRSGIGHTYYGQKVVESVEKMT